MEVINKVFVKQIITKKSKEQLRENFKQQKQQLDQECQQLLFEQRKLQNKSPQRKQDVKEKFQNEIETRKEQMAMLDFKLEQLDLLAIGSEIVETEIDAPIEVEVGMNWTEMMKHRAIIIQDDVVIRIDE